MKYDRVNPELFKINRKRFVKEMKPASMAIFHSNDLMPRNGDQHYQFRQNSDLFGLSGLDQEESILILFPECVKKEFCELAFIKKSNQKVATWEGHKYTKEEASTLSGISKIMWVDDYQRILNQLVLMAERIYLNVNENDRYHSEVESRDLREGKKLRSKYPFHHYERAQPILKEMAMIKSTYEVELISRAVDISRIAFERVLKVVEPGMHEFEVEAELISAFIRNRATGHAYAPIVASGANACILHYQANNQQCKDGDMLLLDFGAEYANYAADLTRTIPINGQFSDRQKAVYNAVLRVMKEAKQMLVPGTILDEYQKEVGRIMESELLGLGLVSREEVAKQNGQHPAYKKYFMHGTSHHLGLDVHDLCNRYMPIRAGMVFTCEPGIYIPEESLGIRLENDILVTDNGPLDLSANVPIEIEELEEAMHSGIYH
jgi:Xaa-Pro aminopeptidase